ncbi:MAG: hypothetical protein ABI036_06285 [Fibrobacteria bacterium]
MKLEGTPKPHGSEARRFSAASAASNAASIAGTKAAQKSGAAGKSFGDLLRKAASAPAEAPVASQSPRADMPVSQTASAESPQPGKPSGEAVPASQASGDSFENHMDLVKLRLKAGYYSGSNIDEALSDRLSGYFDELG